MRGAIASVVMTIVIGRLAGPAAADETSRALAAQALALCKSIDRLSSGDPQATLARMEEGIRLSEAAVAADADDANAQLALFCNLGRQLDLAGLGWRTFGRLRRARAAMDRAYELAPDDPDVLIAKGEMLLRLPAVLGGDKAGGIVLLRRAVELHPGHVGARLHLARAMAADRAPEARACISEALALAERGGAEREESEARALLASLDQ
jgi:cytochrome c-type biogenesis protein CcmH/NrfG